ncbi:MAG: hypothetical protein EP319_10595 [Deltaproteobacteria bacterium]|nr:MAG: hypothetical protein EP319_10595 [Deltaproteobacteria bacterium]
MKKILFSFFLAISANASFNEFGINNSKIIKLDQDIIVLKEPTTIVADKVVINAAIITNGYKFEVGAHEIEFGKKGIIYSYGEHLAVDYSKEHGISEYEAEEKLHNANSCFSGKIKKIEKRPKLGNPSNISGPARAATSGSGAGHGIQGIHGTPGLKGERGKDGDYNPMPVVLLANRFTGEPAKIIGKGQTGQAGQDGQDGQNGGRGQTGGKGYAFCYREPWISDIERRGGNGGKGGFAGRGGDGGNGGFGGSNIELLLFHGGTNRVFKDTKLISEVGDGGLGGNFGANGNPGAGGTRGDGDYDSKWFKTKIFGKWFKTRICSARAASGRPGVSGTESLNTFQGCGNTPRTLGAKGKNGCEFKFLNRPVKKGTLDLLEDKYSEMKKNLLRFFFYKRFALLYAETIATVSEVENIYEELLDENSDKLTLKDEARELILSMIKDWNRYFIRPLNENVPESSKSPLSKGDVKSAIKVATELTGLLVKLYEEKEIQSAEFLQHKSYFKHKLNESIVNTSYGCEGLIEERQATVAYFLRSKVKLDRNSSLKEYKLCINNENFLARDTGRSELNFYDFKFIRMVDQLYSAKSCQSFENTRVTKINISKIINNDFELESENLEVSRGSFCNGGNKTLVGRRDVAQTRGRLDINIREVVEIIKLHERLFDSETPLERGAQDYKLKTLKMPSMQDVKESRAFHLKLTTSYGGAR